MTLTAPGWLPSKLPAAARTEFVAPFIAAYGHQPSPSAIDGYLAVGTVFQLLHRAGSKANERSVLIRELVPKGFEWSDSPVGPFTIADTGDTHPDAFVFVQIRDGRLVATKAAPSS